MSYFYDVYLSRINHLGQTTAERIRNGGIRSFYKWMSESPHTVRHLSVERGIYFSGIILTKTDKEYRKDMYLNVANDVPLHVGDIMTWNNDDGSEEKWLLIQEEKKVNGTYRTFMIVRCKYYLRWIDGQGHRQGSWAYFVSSVDSKVKGNYRTWHNLITPQPNKYAEIIMPYYKVDRATNFIVEDESWSMIECDFSSVPGTIYMSLTENKINSIYDKIDEDIADTDKEAKYKIEMPATPQIFTVNTDIEPEVIIAKNGVLLTKLPRLEYISADATIAKNVDGALRAIKEGETEIEVRFKDYPTAQIMGTIPIKVISSNESSIQTVHLIGNDFIRLGRTSSYTLTDNTVDLTSIVIHGLIATEDTETHKTVWVDTGETNLAKIIETTIDEEAGTILIKVMANDKNKLGYCRLIAGNYIKDIEIRSLW